MNSPILPALSALVTEFMPAVRLSTLATALDAGDWQRARQGKPTQLYNN